MEETILDTCSTDELIEALNRRATNEITEIEQRYEVEIKDLLDRAKRLEGQRSIALNEFFKTIFPTCPVNDDGSIDTHVYETMTGDNTFGLCFEISEKYLPDNIKDILVGLRESKSMASQKRAELIDEIGAKTNDAKDRSMVYLVHRYLSPKATSRKPIQKVADRACLNQ